MGGTRFFRMGVLGLFALAGLAGCGGAEDGASALGVTSASGASGDGAADSSCGTGDICLGLKMVSYSDGTSSVLDRAAAGRLIAGMNGIWSQCGIGFRLEDFEVLEPKNVGLPLTTQYMSELPDIRGTLQSPNQLLVVLTERWGSAGDINDSGADAWTTLPGSPPYGAIIDEPVAENSNIIAHEIGHYLGLDEEDLQRRGLE